MKKGWKWKLIGILGAMLSLCLFVGCNGRETLEDKKEQFDIVAQITYHTNLKGEASIGDTYAEDKILYYPENSPAFPLAHSEDTTNVTSNKTGVVLNYDNLKWELLGWYEPKLDDDGNEQKDKDGNVILKDTPLDFSTLRLHKGDDYHVYAQWKKKKMVLVQLVCDADAVLRSANTSDTKEYKNGDIIKEYTFDKNGKRDYPSAFFTVRDAEYSFTEFYKTADVSNPANMMRIPKDDNDTENWPIQKTAEEDVVIYAHYIKGDYTVLKTAESISSFFRNAKSAKNYYLLYDIDCSALKAFSPMDDYKAKLYGNGHTISNLKIEKTGVKEDALFGDIGANALLKDVTFENVTVNYTTDGRTKFVQTYWLFTSCKNATAFENVTFTGATFAITKDSVGTQITNMEIGAFQTVEGEETFVLEKYIEDRNSYLYAETEFAVAGITYATPVTVTIDGNTI